MRTWGKKILGYAGSNLCSNLGFKKYLWQINPVESFQFKFMLQVLLWALKNFTALNVSEKSFKYISQNIVNYEKLLYVFKVFKKCNNVNWNDRKLL